MLQLQPSEIKRMLIIKPRGTGDVVLSTIMLENLKQHFPFSEIDYFSDPVNKQVLEGLPQLRTVFGVNTKQTGTWSAIKLIRKEKYDLVIDLYCNPRTALLTFSSGAKYRAGFQFKNRTYAYNILADHKNGTISSVEYYLEMLNRLGVPILDRSLKFPLDQHDPSRHNDFFKPFKHQLNIGLFLAGGWQAKKFPGRRLAQLGKKIHEELKANIFVGYGPSEKPDMEEFRAHAEFTYHVLPDKSFTDVGYSSTQMNLVIVNDSGPMHVAAAVGTKVLGIFGPTNPKHWAPYGEKSTWIRHEKLSCLACEELNCPIVGHPCMNEISLDEIVKKAKSMLTENEVKLS